MSGLALRLSSRDARAALAAAFVSAAQLLDGATAEEAEAAGVARQGSHHGGLAPMAVDLGEWCRQKRV